MHRFLALAYLLAAPLTHAGGFDSQWFADPLWNDGKAELNFYDVSEIREGAARNTRNTKGIFLIVRETFDPDTRVKTDEWQRPGAFAVLKLNQILHIPTGVFFYQQMHSAFWRCSDARLVKFSMTSNDGCGNTFKLGEPSEENRWRSLYFTYWDGMAEGTDFFQRPINGIFYDELPMRVRAIDFSAGEQKFTIPLAQTIVTSQRTKIEFQPATVSVLPSGPVAQITITHAGGKDFFEVETAKPHLLQHWKKASGAEYRLRRSLRIEYWKYANDGDLERILADPAPIVR